jgi:phosphoglycerol transferase
MLVSVLMILLAFALLRLRAHGRWLGYFFPIAVILLTVLTGLQYGLHKITGEGINGAVFYHLKTGLEGGDVSQYSWEIAMAFAALALVAGALWFARGWLQPGSYASAPVWDTLTALFILAAVMLHPALIASAAYSLRFSLADQQVEGFHDPPRQPAGPEKPRNLVIVYLESLERTYMDEARFPGLTPALSALQNKAITFTDIGQTTGATFTVGGMVATQCGVPLILSGGGGNQMRVTQFMTGATCLGDILSEADYQLSYMGGASLQFAGKGAFFQSHGFDQVRGRDELLPLLNDPSYKSEWGLQDDSLFELARANLDQLSASGRPFVLSLLTLDTHHPNGHASTNRGCAGLEYDDGSNPILNAVLCNDFLVGQFIEEILSGPNAANTVVAVMSDHLAMGNTATDQLKSGPRRNLFMLLDQNSLASPRQVDRPATTLDVGPTLLSYLGFDIPKMGLGVDLLGTEPTMPEELGVAADDRQNLNAHVLGFQSVYTRLWDFPDISDGLYVNVEGSEASYGSSAFPIPIMLAFDGDHAITEISLSKDPAYNDSLTQVVLKQPSGTSYMWFDDCRALGVLRPSERLEDRKALCLASGQRGVSATVRAVPRSTYLSTEELATMLTPSHDGAGASDTETLERIGKLRGDLAEVVTYEALETGDRGVLLQSSAFGAGSSLVRRQTTDTLATGQDWRVGRGLHLLGISADGRAKRLDSMDQCQRGFKASDHTPWAEQISASKDRFVAHVLLVKDTAYCGRAADKIAPALEGLAMPMLSALKSRQPYIGLIDASGDVQEFGNAAFPRVRLLLMPAGAVPPQHTPAKVVEATQIAPKAPKPVIVAKTATLTQPIPAPTTVTTAASAKIDEPELLGCVTPEATTAQVPKTALPPAIRVAGQDMTGPLGFGNGWWAQESAGRWSSTRNLEFILVLPRTNRGLVLTLNLASFEDRVVTLFHDGVQLASQPVKGNVRFNAELGMLPRDVPLTLQLSIGGPDLTCPLSRGLSRDARQMGVMLKGFSLSESDGQAAQQPLVAVPAPAAVPSPAAAPEPAAVSGPFPLAVSMPLSGGAAKRTEGCTSPEPDRAIPIGGLTSLPLARVVPVPEAENSAFMGFGTGWWAPEAFGRWMGDGEAEIAVVLPDTPSGLTLALSVATFSAGPLDVVLSFEGQQISRQMAWGGQPFIADVSDLPREQQLRLVLTAPGVRLNCPAVRDQASDRRSLGLMLQSVRLDPETTVPFGSSIGLGGGRFGEWVASNSFDALGANLERFDVFEIDLEWTAEGELVCIDDWQQSFEARFGAPISSTPDHDLFRQLLAASPDAPRNCDLDGLAGWLRANPRTRIVTDVTNDPVAANAVISERHPDLRTQIIPQVSLPEHITELRALGFAEVIWEPEADMQLNAVTAEAQDKAPTALILTMDAAQGGLVQALTSSTALPVYLRASNDPDEVACWLSEGAAGILSDELGAEQVDALRDLPNPCPS